MLTSPCRRGHEVNLLSPRQQTNISQRQPLRLPKSVNTNLIPIMKPSELFGVFVRVAGFLIVIYGLYELWGGFDNIAENLLSASQDDGSDQTSSFSYFAFGIPSLIVGGICFFLADWIVRLTYRNSSG